MRLPRASHTIRSASLATTTGAADAWHPNPGQPRVLLVNPSDVSFGVTADAVLRAALDRESLTGVEDESIPLRSDSQSIPALSRIENDPVLSQS